MRLVLLAFAVVAAEIEIATPATGNSTRSGSSDTLRPRSVVLGMLRPPASASVCFAGHGYQTWIQDDGADRPVLVRVWRASALEPRALAALPFVLAAAAVGG